MSAAASHVVLPRLKNFNQVSFVANAVTSSADKMKGGRGKGEWLDPF